MHAAVHADKLLDRFRGYMPVVVDVESGGFNSQRDALLEIAAVPITLNAQGLFEPMPVISTHVTPFPGANIDPRSLEVTGIDVENPLRGALDEREALEHIFKPVRAALKAHGCKRAILVGHNAHFDLNFLNEAIRRTGNKKSPFHPFSVFDTVTLAGVCLGQTVLAKALWAAGMEWHAAEAHSAVYDAQKTAELFCLLLNRIKALAPMPQAVAADGSLSVEPSIAEELPSVELD